ncbi:MAG: hypothetical protein ACO201_04770 [Rickettsiales bacterium]
MTINIFENNFLIFKNSLHLLNSRFQANFKELILKIGCELEFYLPNLSSNQLENLLNDKFLQNFQIKKEQGDSQFELVFNHSTDIAGLASQIILVKNYILNLAKNLNLQAIFLGKPFADDCPSALQFNISIHQKNGVNLFNKNSDLMFNICNSLLDLSEQMLYLLNNDEKDFLRYNQQLNLDLFKNGKYIAPINLSLGFDNRTCAIRLANSFDDNLSKRLEFRLASSNADIYLAFSAIILAIKNGLNYQKNSFNIIYGNSFDEQYNCKKIIDDYKLAKKNFFCDDNFFLYYFNKLLFNNYSE